MASAGYMTFSASAGEAAGGEETTCCWWFRPSYNRFLALVYICIIVFCTSYAVDVPGSLQTYIEQTFHFKSYQFEYLYLANAVPRAFLCLTGGLLVDRVLGAHQAAVVLASVGVTGQVLIVISGFAQLYWMTVAGRFISGIGSGALGIISLYYVTLWFQEKEMYFASGLVLTVSKLGSAAVFLVSPALFRLIDSDFKKQCKIAIAFTPGVLCFTAVIVFSSLLVVLGFKNGKNNSTGSEMFQEIQFRETFSLGLAFWLVTLITSALTITTVTFNTLAQRLLMLRLDVSVGESNDLICLFNVMTAIAAPLLGWIIDRSGCEIVFLLTGLLTGIISQVMLAFTHLSPYTFIILFASCSSIASSCAWPMISLVVRNHQIGTAYGVAQMIVDLLFCQIALLAGYLLDTYGYQGVALLFLFFYLAGFVCTIILFRSDCYSEGTLNMTPEQRMWYRIARDRQTYPRCQSY